MDKREIHLVIAGNYKEFSDYCELHNKNKNIDCRYVKCEHDLMGFNPKIAKIVKLNLHEENIIYKDKCAAERIKIMEQDQKEKKNDK